MYDNIKITWSFNSHINRKFFFPIKTLKNKNEFSIEKKLSLIYSKSNNLEFKIIGKIMQFWVIYLKYITNMCIYYCKNYLNK